MHFNYETLNPLPCTMFEEQLKIKGITYEKFNNNWKEILVKIKKSKMSTK